MAAPEPEAKPEKPAKPAVAAPKTSNPDSGKTVEEIIARVNNEIITRSEYDKARQTAEEDAKSECQNRCTPEQLQAAVEDRRKNTLRDLVDQSLLVQRAKDMGVSVEPELIKRLDAIRIENKLASMEELEKAVSSQGLNWEDFKNNIRNTLLTQRVIGNEVGSHITISDDEVSKYYEAHKAEYVRPEQVALREIVVSTEGKKPEELPDLKKKAETALKRVQDGEDFGEIAKRLSDGSTKSQGGFLGIYKRGELSKELEDKVFQMKRNQLTDVMAVRIQDLVFVLQDIFELQAIGFTESGLQKASRDFEPDKIVVLRRGIAPLRHLQNVKAKFGAYVCERIILVSDGVAEFLFQIWIQDRNGSIRGDAMAIVVGGVVRQRAEREGVVVDVLGVVQQSTDEISAADIVGEVTEKMTPVRVVAHVLDDGAAIGEGLRGVQFLIGCFWIFLM